MDPFSPATETNFKSKEQKTPATKQFKFRTELEAVSSRVENFDSSIKIPTLFDLNNIVKNIDSEDSLDKFLRKFLWFYMNDVGLNREETIISQLSLLDYLTRCHGRFLIPRITTTIVKVLLQLLSSNSNPSLTSQIYCSRVISSMVNSMAGANWQNSQHAVTVVSCVLIQFLFGKGKFSSVASAILLRALVGTEAWKYASDDIVNKVYFKIAVLLEKKETQTPFHLNLLCCLIKKNGHIASSYVRSMLSCAKKILLTGSDHERRFCAVQMINCILKYADVNVKSPRFLKCMRIIKWRHGFDQCPAIRDVCAETIEEFKFSTSLLGLTLAEGLSVEQGEDHGSCSVSAIRTWVSSYPVFDPHVCIGDCCLRLDTRNSNSLFASKSNTPKVPPAEAQICENMLELVRRTRISKDNHNHSNSKRLVPQQDRRDSISSTLSQFTSNFKITEQPVTKKSDIDGGLVSQLRIQAARHSGKGIGGLVVLVFAAGIAMAVLKCPSETTPSK